jgi:hypothetical protein
MNYYDDSTSRIIHGGWGKTGNATAFMNKDIGYEKPYRKFRTIKPIP